MMIEEMQMQKNFGWNTAKCYYARVVIKPKNSNYGH